ncbi:hypothetical protein F2Q69_00009463 [Brassica cretica]|uniref:Uncharacterized protein n=1 Tax=Brassica cretica TaxID=69181 RepID=A0A8S9NT82_BRACR|nr:hypothetical protein F2Q69_00009463 [Brassica cretica]
MSVKSALAACRVICARSEFNKSGCRYGLWSRTAFDLSRNLKGVLSLRFKHPSVLKGGDLVKFVVAFGGMRFFYFPSVIPWRTSQCCELSVGFPCSASVSSMVMVISFVAFIVSQLLLK